MRLLRHSEHLAHLRGRRRSTAQTSMCKAAEATLLGKTIRLAQLLEVWVLEGLRRRQPMVVIVNEKLRDNVARFRVLRYHFREARALLYREVKLHVTCDLLKLIEQLLLRRAQYVVNLVHLVELISAWEQRRQSQHLVEDAADAPIVHLVIVVAVS